MSTSSRLTVYVAVLFTLCGVFLSDVAAQKAKPAAPSLDLPPISGTVVDALTGRPVSDIDVILSAQSIDKDRPFKLESCKTAVDGRFQFAAIKNPSPHPELPFAMPLAASLTVNVIFRPPHPAGTSEPDDGANPGALDATDIAMWATLPERERKGIGDRRADTAEWLNNNSYFPVTVQPFSDCGGGWTATCVSPPSIQGLTIRLVPVFEKPADCDKIPEADARDRCRQLNTFRAAFLHVDSFTQISEGKKNCESLENSYVAKRCLELLHNYVRPIDPRDPVRPSLLREYKPIDSLVIMKPVAGMAPVRPMLNHVDPFDETATYVIHYKREGDAFEFDTVTALVILAKAGVANKKVLDYQLRWDDDNPKPIRGTETFMGHPVSTLRVRNLYRVAWPSGDQVVSLQFSYGDPAHLSPDVVSKGTITDEMKREMIEAYLAKYPPSS